MTTAATVTAAVRGQEKEQQPTQPPAASQSCRHRVPAVQEWDRRVAVTDPVTDEWLKVTEVQRPPQGHTARRWWCWDRGPCSRPLLQHRLLRPRPSPPRCGLPGTGAPSLWFQSPVEETPWARDTPGIGSSGRGEVGSGVSLGVSEVAAGFLPAPFKRRA